MKQDPVELLNLPLSLKCFLCNPVNIFQLVNTVYYLRLRSCPSLNQLFLCNIINKSSADCFTSAECFIQVVVDFFHFDNIINRVNGVNNIIIVSKICAEIIVDLIQVVQIIITQLIKIIVTEIVIFVDQLILSVILQIIVVRKQLIIDCHIGHSCQLLQQLSQEAVLRLGQLRMQLRM